MSDTDPTPEAPNEAVIAAFPARPEDRLRLALHRLDAAIGEQSAAAASLRAAVGELSGSMARLGNSVADYRAALAVTAGEVDRAVEAARRLEETAERMAV